MIAHGGCKVFTSCLLGYHIATVANMSAWPLMICDYKVGAEYFTVFFHHKCLSWEFHPQFKGSRFVGVCRVAVGIPFAGYVVKDWPNFFKVIWLSYADVQETRLLLTKVFKAQHNCST